MCAHRTCKHGAGDHSPRRASANPDQGVHRRRGAEAVRHGCFAMAARGAGGGGVVGGVLSPYHVEAIERAELDRNCIECTEEGKSPSAL